MHQITYFPPIEFYKDTKIFYVTNVECMKGKLLSIAHPFLTHARVADVSLRKKEIAYASAKFLNVLSDARES